jgi:hypothetical protein
MGSNLRENTPPGWRVAGAKHCPNGYAQKLSEHEGEHDRDVRVIEHTMESGVHVVPELQNVREGGRNPQVPNPRNVAFESGRVVHHRRGRRYRVRG